MELNLKTRDDIVKALRPELGLGMSSTTTETFQNNVLRPILKFQNDLLLEAVKHYCHKQFKAFTALKSSAQQQLIKQAAKQDPELRYLLVNLVVAVFTTQEFQKYAQYRPELNKRIVQMATERVLSQLDLLI